MLLKISNRIHIPLEESHKAILERIQERFSYRNPVYIEQLKKKIKNPTVDEYIYNWDFSEIDGHTHLGIPRGQMGWLREFLKGEQVDYKILDMRSPGHPIEVSFDYTKLTPYDYQLKDSLEILKYEQGTWCYWPGAGKTILGLHALGEHIKSSCLILVNSNELAKQWASKIRLCLNYKDDIGLIQQSTVNLKGITIGLMQTIMRWNVERIRELNDYFGVLIHDEAHHSPSESSQFILNELSQKYRIALTANKTRKDGLEFLVYDYYDKIRSYVKGNILTPTVHQLHTGVKIPWKPRSRWTTIEKKLSENQGRIGQIISEIQQDLKFGHTVLALFGRTQAAEKVNRILQNLGYKSVCLTSEKPFDIDEVYDKVICGEIEVITSCRVFDEGIDIPPLSSLHLTSHSSNMEMIRQRIGRVCRIFPGKLMPKVTDYIDNIIPCIVGGKKRLQLYKELDFIVANGFYDRVNPGLF